MTVKELIERLNEFDSDTLVAVYDDLEAMHLTTVEFEPERHEENDYCVTCMVQHDKTVPAHVLLVGTSYVDQCDRRTV